MTGEQLLVLHAQALGFAKAALCLPEGFGQAKNVVDQQEKISERRQLRFFPAEDYPQIKSLAVLLWPYAPSSATAEGELFVDSYYAASNAAYHAARTLESQMLDEGYFVKANVSYPAKSAAVRAGLGVIGKNSLLITPDYGSRIVIILMATDIIPDSCDIMYEPHGCMNCGNCAAACPVGAITEQGMVHPEKCLRNYIMEGVVVPKEVREKMGMRLIGCDTCQRVCPMQPNVIASGQLRRTLDDFMLEDGFSGAAACLAGEIGRNAARPQRIRAQAALLAGNSKDPAYLPVLRAWADLPYDAVSTHAAWAIDQIELAKKRT